MVYVTPDFYPEFQCIASRCRHSCCIGWEIDIDKESLRRYQEMAGPLGDKLRAHISPEKPSHFILGEKERCPFLNDQQLCELILAEGEECLCEICAEHPRFYNEYSGRCEAGLGLCCEEAARLLLDWDCGVTLMEFSDGEEDGDEENQPNLEQREQLFALAQDRSVPIRLRMENILRYVNYMSLDHLLQKNWPEVYSSLERLDESWTDILRELSEMERCAESLDDESLACGYENLLVYFLYRHFMNMENKAAAAAFAVLSTAVIAAADSAYLTKHGELSLEQRVEHVRLYSSEIEYSDENVDALLEWLEEQRKEN